MQKFEYFSEHAEKWLTDNGYTFVVLKKYQYKNKYKVSKEGIELIWSANDTIRDYDAGIKQFQEMFDMAAKL